MSLQAMVWAYGQTTGSSHRKSVLVAMANFANEIGMSYPCVDTIARMTEQDDKTVRIALGYLVTRGLIEDTGEVVGRTGQVRVYQFPEEARAFRSKIPKNGYLKDTQPGLKDTQKDTQPDTERYPERYPNLGSNPLYPKEPLEPMNSTPIVPLVLDGATETANTMALAIYQEYPRKVGRANALRAILKSLKKVPYGELMAKTKAYARSVEHKVHTEEIKYIPHPATWFNREHWADEAPPPPDKPQRPPVREHTDEECAQLEALCREKGWKV